MTDPSLVLASFNASTRPEDVLMAFHRVHDSSEERHILHLPLGTTASQLSLGCISCIPSVIIMHSAESSRLTLFSTAWKVVSDMVCSFFPRCLQYKGVLAGRSGVMELAGIILYITGTPNKRQASLALREDTAAVPKLLQLKKDEEQMKGGEKGYTLQTT